MPWEFWALSLILWQLYWYLVPDGARIVTDGKLRTLCLWHHVVLVSLVLIVTFVQKWLIRCLEKRGQLITNFAFLGKVLKPWPNGLASRRKFWTFNLRFVWPPTCVDLHRLATTCVDFGRAQIWTKVFLLFGHPAQVDTRWSQVLCCYKNALIYDMREIYGFLRFAGRLANPFEHPSHVRTQVLV